MVCLNSVSTRSGKFTFFDEFVSKCQAEKKCKKRGEILAPITNRRDKKKILNLFMSINDGEDCMFTWHAGADYWLGLDETFTENGQPKMFTNGVKWNQRKHSRIYLNGAKNYTDCGIALFNPIFRDEPESFQIGPESADCNWGRKSFYACFKPAGDSTAESIVQENIENEMVLSTGSVFAVGLIAGVFAGVMAGVGLLRRKHAKERTELIELRKAKKSEMENSSVYDIAVGEIQ